MYKAMKVLAIVVLLVTIAGAGAVLYGLNTMTPAVEQVTVTVTPASQAAETFEQILRQIEEGTFAGRVYVQPEELDMADCTFLTYSLRLTNKGFFPAEWISLSFTPREDVENGTRDYLQVDNYGANVLTSGSTGDLSTTILTTIDPENTLARIEGIGHVLGEKVLFRADVE